MFCPKCNFNNSPKARFCQNCGFLLNTVAIKEQPIVQEVKKNPEFLTRKEVFEVVCKAPLGLLILGLLVLGLAGPRNTNVSVAVHANPLFTLLWGLLGAWLIYSIFKIQGRVNKRG